MDLVQGSNSAVDTMLYAMKTRGIYTMAELFEAQLALIQI